MNKEDVKALPIAEKLQIMEVIWEDLKERFETTEVTEPVKRLLDERRSRVEQGTARLMEWEAAKSRLGKP